MDYDLLSPVSSLFMVGSVYAKRLAKLGIITIEDLLNHFPFRYEDYSLITPITQIQAGETVTIRGEILEIKNIFTKYGKKLTKAKIGDNTGIISAVWYNQIFLTRTLKKGVKASLSGKADRFNYELVLNSPEHEIIKDNKVSIHTGRLVPIYPETYGVSSKWLRSRIYPILQMNLTNFADYLPENIRKSGNLLSLPEAIDQIHFPDNLSIGQKARERLAFDELFLIQINSQKRKLEWENDTVGHKFTIDQDKVLDFINRLPFNLTTAQNNSVRDILSDLAKDSPMNRLLQGDVGSGKTVVAAIAIFTSVLNGFQSALMAPTEILAEQHFTTIGKLLSQFGIKVVLQTGTQKNADRSGWDVIIGTHALLSKNLKYDNLGLVVIDEQQRFGVEQRFELQNKGVNPHLLSMTATPIPRTVALTLYGELDLSILDELPVGRKKIKTWVVPSIKRNSAYSWIEKQIMTNNSQAFIICPLIEESETLASVKAVKKELENLKKFFPSLSIGLLHGRLKSKQKSEVLQDFRDNKTQILLSTPVVEVGIDVPNATIMMIEGSDRFGLAQLHQLRGRVGRGEKISYCLLFTENESPIVLKRLKFLESKYIGSELAEIDLKLRGPGEIFGTKQHGFLNLKIASLTDANLIEKTKTEAQKLLSENSSLSRFPILKDALKRLKIENTVSN